jgi:hypothetical protein
MTCRRVLLTVLLCLIAPSVFARKRETGFLDRTVSVNARVYRYQVFVPQNYDPHKKWPGLARTKAARLIWSDAQPTEGSSTLGLDRNQYLKPFKPVTVFGVQSPTSATVR